MAVKCKNIEQALEQLRQHAAETACRFICYTSVKSFSNSEITPTAKMTTHFDADGIPYFTFGSRIYLCSQGKDINLAKKKKYADKRDEKALTDFNCTKRCNVKRATKKRGCPAQIKMKRILLLKDYQLQDLTEYKKRKTIEAIKSALLANENLNGEDCIIFSFPQLNEHKNHPVRKNAKLSKCVHDLIRNKIEQLVGEGIRNVQIIQEYVMDYVKSALQVDDEDRNMHRYKPERKLIQAIINRCESQVKRSQIDQQNITAMIEKWNKQECNVFFRPNVIQDSDDDTEMENKLLFVYQNRNMQRLYELYGKNSILLDAAYKTCEYALPLYFLVVRTNVDYQVVGIFVTQFETMESISEALALIKKWNPSIEPKYGMVALAAKEIRALEKVFPEIQVFICAFHREQAWLRWGTTQEQNSLSEMNKSFLEYLRAIANAPTQEELSITIQNLHNWEHFNNPSLKSYFEYTWKPEIKRWALAYKPYDLLFDNGVEQTNEELEYKDLHDYKQCSLSDMIEVVATKFIPSHYDVYCRENDRIHRTCSRDLPEYLHNRPAWLIDHVQKLVSPNQDLERRTPLLDANKLQVPSSTNHYLNYQVFISKSGEMCTCTCEDYRRQRLICKHIMMVGSKFHDWRLEKIASWVFKNPVFGMDKHCIGYEEVESCVKENDNPNDQRIILFDDVEDHQSENHEPLVSDINLEEEQQSRVSQPRKRKKNELISDIKAKMRSIESSLLTLPNEQLEHVYETLNELEGCEKSDNL